MQARGRSTVEAIIEAAAQLLVRRGWTASTTNHIAVRAGVSIGSLYKYFPNKASIVAEVARHRIADEVRALETALASPTLDPRGTLEAIVHAMADRYIANAALDTALLEQLGAMELTAHLRAGETVVVTCVAAFFGLHRAALRVEGHDAAFILVHALRGALVAAAAHAPAGLASDAFRTQLVTLMARYCFP